MKYGGGFSLRLAEKHRFLPRAGLETQGGLIRQSAGAGLQSLSCQSQDAPPMQGPRVLRVGIPRRVFISLDSLVRTAQSVAVPLRFLVKKRRTSRNPGEKGGGNWVDRIVTGGPEAP